jgi:hypothetical protein
VVGNAQKVDALSAGHCPSNLEGNACKCQRLCHVASTRPSVKCQRSVGFKLGFGGGRGRHKRTTVDTLIQHHAQILSRTSFVLDATLLVHFEFKRFARSSPSVWHHVQGIFGSGLSGPNIPRTACIPRAIRGCKIPAFIRTLLFYQGGRPASFTRKTHKIPGDGDTDVSGRFRESTGAQKACWTLTEWGDSRFLPVYHRTADALACF